MKTAIFSNAGGTEAAGAGGLLTNKAKGARMCLRTAHSAQRTAHSAQRRRWVSSLLTAAALFICGGALSAQTAGSDYTVKAGDTLSGIAQAAYGDMTLWGGVWEANKAKLPSAANPHNLPAGTVLSLPRFDTEAAKTSARNARHAAPAFTGTGAAVPANVKPVPYGNSGMEYLPIAFTEKQLDALVSYGRGANFGADTYTYGGTEGWGLAAVTTMGNGDYWQSDGLIATITAKNPEMLKYALGYAFDHSNLSILFFYKGETLGLDKVPTGTIRYVLVRRAE